MEKDEFDKIMSNAFKDAKDSFHLYDAVKNIKKWGAERGITDGDPSRQLNKLMEELGELAEGFNKKVPEQIEDSLGDMFVVMTLFAEQNGLNIIDCIESAYDTIKDREGKNVDGVFVKSEDLVDE
ncbi:MazG-like family protein [Pediococcus acidilactici]|uniref:MazG-like family protein n=1 Tax=Pediococcus acidilactici TaxID=1254 RepID=UPI00232EB539|nr:MazG-like family protein [Pediococcus acidilactici]MDB8869520.1 MazG-like family protein [Pediococcus acidilactici]